APPVAPAAAASRGRSGAPRWRHCSAVQYSPRSAKKKPKRKPFCLNGSTVQATGKKVKKLKKQGATAGACPDVCTPQCNKVSCGGPDSCGGTCGCNAGSVCDEGACTACTVKCTGTALGCGSELTQALTGGGRIVLCPGTYSTSAIGFDITKDTTLIGAGSGSDPASSTILDGQDQRIVLLNTSKKTLTMRGVRVTRGKYSAGGGGLFVGEDADIRVSDCAFVANSGTGGGAISSFSKLRLTRTVFDRNTATTTDGGGVLVFDAGPSFITDCEFTGNSTVAYGGGLKVNDTNVTITGCTFRGNTASRGGGLAVEDGTVNLDSATTITGNTASTYGGGAWRTSGVLNLNGANISGNFSANPPADCGGGCT
ncbi:MAG: right-handed parallel beta-helix repeat-containing protein, partial [Thermomicrobiales bacterium]